MNHFIRLRSSDVHNASASSPSLAVDVRRPSFPGCRLASLEQSATSRHVCMTVTACFLQSSEDSSLQSQFSLTISSCLRSDTRHYGHINRCSYLLNASRCFAFRMMVFAVCMADGQRNRDQHRSLDPRGKGVFRGAGGMPLQLPQIMVTTDSHIA